MGAVIISAHRSGWCRDSVLLKLPKSEECCLLGWVVLLPHASGYPGLKVSFPINDLAIVHDGKLNTAMAVVVMSTSVTEDKATPMFC